MQQVMMTGLFRICCSGSRAKLQPVNMCPGNKYQYEDRFAAKNTINFFGLVSLCVGNRIGRGR